MTEPYPRVTFDEVKYFQGFHGFLSRVRVRRIEVNDSTVAIVFSENRRKSEDDGTPAAAREVTNPGTSVTNAIGILAHLADFAWKLVPEKGRVRWFEHYAGEPEVNDRKNQDLMAVSTIDEVYFDTVIDPGNFTFRPTTRVHRVVIDGQSVLVAQVTQEGRWQNPSWRPVTLTEGRKMLGLDL